MLCLLQMTAKEAFTTFKEQLTPLYGANEAAAITDIALAHFAGITKQQLLLDPKIEISLQLEAVLQNALARLIETEPLQYVMGCTYFLSRKIFCNKYVLIPRPETEELVLLAIEAIKESRYKNIIDIGTGSGCIPISVAVETSNTTIFAIDISTDALQVAKQNAVEHNANISFLELDFLQKENIDLLPNVDVIISNPPYIPLLDKATMHNNVVKYEPHVALFVENENPLIFYQQIADYATQKLSLNGMIFLETHQNLAQATTAVFDKTYFKTNIKLDMQGKERFVLVTRYR
jgi:release factor glutamine methyltransferase